MSYDWSSTPLATVPAAAQDRLQALDDHVEAQLSRVGDELAVGLRSWFVRFGNRDRVTPLRVMVLGDSHVTGQGASTAGSRWIERMGRRLASRGGVTAGVFYPADSSGVDSFTYPVVNNGGNRRYDIGIGTRCLQFPEGSSGTATFTFTAPGGVGLGVRYLGVGNSTGVMRLVIDGGSPVTFDTGGPGGYNEFALYTTSVLSAGAHTVVVSNASADKSVFVEGFEPDPGAGLKVLDSGWFGSAADGWAGSDRYAGVAAASPDVVVVAVGTNDQAFYSGGSYTHTPASYQTNLTAILANLRDKVPGVPVLVVAMPARDMTGQPAGYAPWSQYVTAMRTVVAADPRAAFLDVAPLLGQVTGDTLGLYADNTHMSDRGHGAAADMVTTVLAGSLIHSA